MPLVEIEMLTEALAKLDYHPAFHLVSRQNGPIDPVALAAPWRHCAPKPITTGT